MRVKGRAVWLVMLTVLAGWPAGAQDLPDVIERGEHLVQSCENYLLTPQSKTHACRSFFIEFFQSSKEADEERFQAMLRGDVVPANGPCYRMPDFISFPDLAKLVVNGASGNQKLLDGTAAALIEGVLATNFPCPDPDLPPSPT
ncbi:MAG: hypothetical protein GC199_03215 [Alphaproteobacteria bacterium]|nr:hypothetical protein [Alphaproteobacteria bacterium]